MKCTKIESTRKQVCAKDVPSALVARNVLHVVRDSDTLRDDTEARHVTWVGRDVCGSALPPAIQGGVEAGTWPTPTRPSIYKAGHWGQAEGWAATQLR